MMHFKYKNINLISQVIYKLFLKFTNYYFYQLIEYKILKIQNLFN